MIFLSIHNKKIICRRCLTSYTVAITLENHKLKQEQQEITTIKTSSERHPQWEKHVQKNPSCFWIIADFEANNEVDNSSIGNKTTNIYKQNPVLKSFYITSELNAVLKSGYCKSPLEHGNVDSCLNENIKLENIMVLYFKNTKKDIIMTKEDEKDYRNNDICQFCEKKINW